jgi:predicted nucleotidyltransferase
MNVGIICEYNPFHYGHLYHLNKIKEMYPNSNIILVMSGWITERGDLSLIDKFKKTDIALYYGVNLVVELPLKYMGSADYFAKGSIEILNKLGCDTIVFGSESNNVDELIDLANIQLNNESYNKLVKEYIDSGINYPTAMSKALKQISGKSIDTPNDILGLSYVKEIIKNNYNIKPITIKRNTNYNSKIIEGKITSATSIRELIKNKKKFKKYVPSYSYKYLNQTIFIDDYFDYLKYRIISSNDLTIYQGVDENLSNRIKKFINSSNSLDELLSNIKTKRYTYNRLKRTLTYILLSITKDDFKNLKLDYIRILGFDKRGKEHLNKIKKDIDVKLLTNYDNKYLSKDLSINSIISLNRKIIDKKSFIEKEYKEKPIIR